MLPEFSQHSCTNCLDSFVVGSAMLRRFTFSLKDQMVLPENKKADVEGSLWELDARTPGKKKKKKRDCGLIAARCSYNMKIDSATTLRLSYKEKYYLTFEIKERKQYPYYFNKK